jgi:hypothetical protein
MAIDELRMALREVLHQQRRGAIRKRRDKKVHMIRHEDVCMKVAFCFRRELCHLVQIEPVVPFGKKMRERLFPRWDDVKRDVREPQTAWTGHVA